MKKANQNSKRPTQTPIDSFFQRSIKLKSGEDVRCLPSNVIAPGFQCPSCSKRCNNQGALATHISMKHPKPTNTYTSSIKQHLKKTNVPAFRNLSIAMVAHTVSLACHLSAILRKMMMKTYPLMFPIMRVMLILK